MITSTPSFYQGQTFKEEELSSKHPKCYYLPSLTSGWNDPYNGKNPLWYRENPLYKYDSFLLSAYYALTNKSFSSRKTLEMRDDVLFFGDSGGFQLYSFVKRDPSRKEKLKQILDPINIINWQQENCQIGMTLDDPITQLPSYSKELFQKSLAFSKQSGDIMREHQTKDAFKLFDVLHGNSKEELLEWKNTTTRDHSFDGYSLVSAGKADTVAKDLGFSIEYLPNTPLHILGASSFRSIAVMVYANTHLNTNLYFDSQSYVMGNKLRHYINPYGKPNWIFVEDSNRPDAFRISEITCTCDICRQINHPSDLWKYKSKSGFLMSLHNLFWYDNYTRTMEQLVKNEDAFKSYISKNFPPDILKYILFLDSVAEDGYDYAYSHYFLNNTQDIGEWI